MTDIFSALPSFYTDLMSERRRAVGEGVEFKRSASSVGVWERVRVMSDVAAEKLGRPIGHYHTLNTERIEMMDSYDSGDVAEELSSELWRILELNALVPKKLLVVGLGNDELTPDALGPKTARQVEATMHLRSTAPEIFSALGCIEIAVLRPGVLAQSGMESSATVKAVCERIKPDLIVAIDALCAESERRLGCTVQISDTGVFPGSGVGNPRDQISKKTVGCDVITIGIPTVIDAGIISKRTSAERMLVTPREINVIVGRGSQIISDAINRAFGIVR